MYNISFQDTVRIAEWLVKNNYKNNILININRIVGLVENDMETGSYIESWCLEYQLETGEYEIYTDNENTREWLDSIIKHVISTGE